MPFQNMGMRRGGAVETPPAGAAPATAPAGATGMDLDHRLKVRERLFAFGDDFWVENARGKRVFVVDGKMLRARDTLYFKENGRERYKLQEKLANVRDTMKVYNANGALAATIKKAIVTPLRERYSVDLPGQAGLETQGNILHHEYTLERRGQKVASISKSWFRVRDTYGIEVVPETIDPLLVVAVTVAIDMMQLGPV